MSYFEVIKTLYNISDKNGFSEDVIDSAIDKYKGLPQVLVEYYKELGKVYNLNHTQDNLIDPDKLNDLGDYIGFYAENQYVCQWCIAKKDINEENPSVYVTLDNKEFIKESGTLLMFLNTMAHMQGAFGLDYGCEDIDEINEEHLELIKANYKKKDFSLKGWLGIEFYGNYTDEVIMVLDNEDYYTLSYASSCEEHFESMDEFFESKIF